MYAYNNENISSNLPNMLSANKLTPKLNELASPSCNDSFSEQNNLAVNFAEKNPLLLDTPVSYKEHAQPCIYTYEDVPTMALAEGRSLTNATSEARAEYKTPSKANQVVNRKGSKLKGGEEDLVTIEQSPNIRVSRGYTPKQMEKELLSAQSKRSSIKQSPKEDPNLATPLSKLAQLRQERREGKMSHLDAQITDIKLEEMQKELKQMPQLSNRSAHREGLKKSIDAMATEPQKFDNSKESLRKSHSFDKSPKAQTQKLSAQDFCDEETKLKENRVISPLPQYDETNKTSFIMEKKYEKESEQTKAIITEMEARLTLEQRLIEHIWQVRRNAYCELGRLFSNKVANDEQNESKSFYQYSSWLSYMLKDMNLIALHEGLNTILIYAQTSPTLGPAVGLVPDLLDKIPLQRNQFQEIVTKILCELVKRNQGQYVVSELVNHFNSKKCTQFALNCLSSMLESELYLKMDLKYIHKAAVVALTSQKEARLQVLKLLQTIFSLVEDSVEGFVSHLPEYTKSLVIKELADSLRTIAKRNIPNRMQMFEESKSAISVLSSHETKRSSSVISGKRDQSKEDRKSRLSVFEKNLDGVNLLDCVDENVLKLGYLTKAEEKKKVMENFNATLQELINKNAKIEKKDYSKIINVLYTVLEDNNMFLELEILKSFQALAILLNKEMQNCKSKQIISKLLDRFKENKTAILTNIESTVTEFLSNGCITSEALIDTIMQKVVNSKNPRVRQMALQVLENQKLSQSSLVNTFDAIIGPKLLSTIKKDPVAGVRDAAVSLLTKIMTQSPNNPDIEKIIAKLPKARVQEIYAQVRAQAHTADNSGLVKSKESFTLLKRSKSDFKKDTNVSRTNAVTSTVSAEEIAIRNSGNKDKAKEASTLPDESVKKLLQVAESCSCSEFIAQLKQIPSEIITTYRSHILYGVTYVFTSQPESYFNLSEAHALSLSEIICPLLSQNKLSEQEINCALSSGIIIAAAISLENGTQRFLVLRTTYHEVELDIFVAALQRVLYTFKYSDKNDSNMTTGMIAYRTVAEWINSDTKEFKETDKLSSVLGINSTMGFKREFILQMEKVKQQLLQRGKTLADQKELKEIITSASAMAMNLKVPTPRVRVSKSQQQFKDIIDAINHKEIFKNKKSLEALHTILDDAINSNLKLNIPLSTLKDLIEGSCKLIGKVQWLEDDVMKILLKIKEVLPPEAHKEVMRTILACLAEYMKPESINHKHLEYYKLLNTWCKDLSKKELSNILSNVFSTLDLNSANDNLLEVRSLLYWFSTQILGDYFASADIEPLLPSIVKGLVSTLELKRVCEELLSKCYKLFGIKKAQYWLEEALAQSQGLYKIYGEWHDNYFKSNTNTKSSLEPKPVEETKLEAPLKTLPKPKQSLETSGLHKVDVETINSDIPVKVELKSPEVIMPPYNAPELSIATEQETKEGHKSLLSQMLARLDNLSSTHSKPHDSSIIEETKEVKQASVQIASESSYATTPTSTAQRKVISYQRLGVGIKGEASSPDYNAKTFPEDRTPSPRFGSELHPTATHKSKDTPSCLQELHHETSSEIPYEVLDKLGENMYRFQCVLASFECNAISASLVNYFAGRSEPDKRLEFAKRLNGALSNEDVLECVPEQNLHSLLDACVKMSVAEKINIMSTGSISEIVSAYNNIVIEFQNCLNKIVNAQDFAQSICVFILLLKENLPNDFSAELTKENIVYLKMVLICLKKTMKAGKDSGLKVFKVLFEMHKLFAKHQPEKLRQDLPSLAVLDQVYRILREVTDMIVDSNVEKAGAFVTWTEENGINGIFLKYVKSLIVKTLKKNIPVKPIN